MFCPGCGKEVPEGFAFCPECGSSVTGAAKKPVNIYDHTEEFDAADVSENKCYALLGYLLGIAGIVVALLAGKNSPFLQFHIRQIIKFTIVTAILGIIAGVLCWTVVIPIAAGICLAIVFILKIISFVRICNGKSIEPAIIRDLGFLK